MTMMIDADDYTLVLAMKMDENGDWVEPDVLINPRVSQGAHARIGEFAKTAVQLRRAGSLTWPLHFTEWRDYAVVPMADGTPPCLVLPEGWVMIPQGSTGSQHMQGNPLFRLGLGERVPDARRSREFGG